MLNPPLRTPHSTDQNVTDQTVTDQTVTPRSKDTIKNLLPRDFVTHIRHTDYECGALKINIAVNKLPNFVCCPTEDPHGKD